VKGSSSRLPRDTTGNPRALAYLSVNICTKLDFRSEEAYSKGMDHGLEPKVHLASSDDLSDVLPSFSKISAINFSYIRWDH
jgi:hypothetical protein